MAMIRKVNLTGNKVAFEVRIRARGHKEIKRRFRSKTLAERWATSIEGKIAEDNTFQTKPGAKVTFSQAVDRYVDSHLATITERAAKCEATRARWWQVRIGHLRLENVGPAEISEGLDSLRADGSGLPTRAKRLSPSTLFYYHRSIKQVLAKCIEWGWLENNPAHRVKPPRPRPGRVRFLGDEERGRLLGACRASESAVLYPLILTLLSTGARFSEAAGLTWAQLDFERGLIHLGTETKTGRPRSLPLTPALAEELRRWRSAQSVVSVLVFPSPTDTTKPVGSVKKAWATACRLARIENFRLHDCRHDTASRLAMSGANLQTVAAILGHATLAMVQRYSHLSKDAVVSAMRAAQAAEGGEK